MIFGRFEKRPYNAICISPTCKRQFTPRVASLQEHLPNYRKISRQIIEQIRAKLPKNFAPNYRILKNCIIFALKMTKI